MKGNLYSNTILNALKEKFRQKSTLTKALAEVLPVDKVGIYRRLRGDVPFTFDEVVLLAKAFNLSLDTLIGTNPGSPSNFHLQVLEQIDPLDVDFALMENVIKVLSDLKDSKESVGGEATNILPQVLYLPYEYITRFYMFKWKYQFSSATQTVTFNDLSISDRMYTLQRHNVKLAKHLFCTDYILDPSIFENLLKDLRYFAKIKLITRQETELIVSDIQKIIMDMEILCDKGCFPETGNKVNIYISHVNFDTSYCYITSKSFQLILIKAFILNAVASSDKETCEKGIFWINSLKRQSNLISEAGQQQRIIYFTRQKQLINEFLQEIQA